MRNRNIVAIIGSLALMIFLLCFGGGCGNNNSNPDSITIFNLSPTSIILIHNSGTTTVTVTFNASGFSDFPTAYFVLLNSSGQTVQTLPDLITNPSSSMVAAFSIDTTNLAAGSSGSFQVYLTDDSGGVSNTLPGTWSAT